MPMLRGGLARWALAGAISLPAAAGWAQEQPAPDCLTWEQFRAGAIVFGPREPIPELPDPYRGGCINGYANGQIDVVSVEPEGTPPPRGAWSPDSFFGSQGPLYGMIPLPPSEARPGPPVPSVSVTFARRSGIGSLQALFERGWDAPHVEAGEDGQPAHGSYRTVLIEGGGLTAEEIRAALASLDGEWVEGERTLANARRRNDLSTLPDGAHHLGEVPGGGGRRHMMFDKRGDRLVGLDYVWQSDAFNCFDMRLEGDGTRGRGRQAVPDVTLDEAEASYRIVENAAFDLEGTDTLRPLPEGMAAEHREMGNLDALLRACLGVLEAPAR